MQYHELNEAKYKNAWEFQTLLHNELKAPKFNKNASNPSKNKTFSPNHLVLCEHTPVITMGKSGKETHMTSDAGTLESAGIEYYKINRGGDITYHGPGQITGYLIFDLEKWQRDVHMFVRTIEGCIIDFLALYGLEGMRLEGYTGVWLGRDDKLWKICAIGVHLSRWISMHGFALNINTDLSHFDHIVPCGIDESDKEVTSLQNELGMPIDYNNARLQLRDIIVKAFNGQLIGH
ncbi:MAG: lipoyl(octanoyl) transferase LipB [Saprospiraceae bacterium]|nr:lipoyl(octanoyl) transferase LipB [Saprospiraceae bacterium]